ncbi:MAG: hypothetical protein JWO79_4789 [Actinomycetia bacterium]|nr:hypothetical protein [Actinomycetes bacterium]
MRSTARSGRLAGPGAAVSPTGLAPSGVASASAGTAGVVISSGTATPVTRAAAASTESPPGCAVVSGRPPGCGSAAWRTGRPTCTSAPPGTALIAVMAAGASVRAIVALGSAAPVAEGVASRKELPPSGSGRGPRSAGAPISASALLATPPLIGVASRDRDEMSAASARGARRGSWGSTARGAGTIGGSIAAGGVWLGSAALAGRPSAGTGTGGIRTAGGTGAVPTASHAGVLSSGLASSTLPGVRSPPDRVGCGAASAGSIPSPRVEARIPPSRGCSGSLSGTTSTTRGSAGRPAGGVDPCAAWRATWLAGGDGFGRGIVLSGFGSGSRAATGSPPREPGSGGPPGCRPGSPARCRARAVSRETSRPGAIRLGRGDGCA